MNDWPASCAACDAEHFSGGSISSKDTRLSCSTDNLQPEAEQQILKHSSQRISRARLRRKQPDSLMPMVAASAHLPVAPEVKCADAQLCLQAFRSQRELANITA